MEGKDIVKHARDLADEANRSCSDGFSSVGAVSKACEFLRTFAGQHSSFYKTVDSLDKYQFEDRVGVAASVLESFADYVESGLAQEISLERQAQLDVVSDLLDQANSLIEDKSVHPAAAAVLIGATLEQFLRSWVEAAGLSLGNKKPSIDSYSKTLREADLIGKQDVKDLTAWAGIRNDAAHGKWEEVDSRGKISLVLQGVNLFLRKYEKGGAI